MTMLTDTMKAAGMKGVSTKAVNASVDRGKQLVREALKNRSGTSTVPKGK